MYKNTTNIMKLLFMGKEALIWHFNATEMPKL